MLVRMVVPGPFCTMELPPLIGPLKVPAMPVAGTNCSVPPPCKVIAPE